ncbi:MAG TPA: hypothetical protein PKZ32_17345 [Candidatus Melainabacteria bacterium]|nr:hypothetical protein [Candidatus Melainabacteria bacterium]
MNSALLSECLRELSAKLDSRDILLSDAILKALKILRIFYGNEKLQFFNRELLGYLQEEMADIEASRKRKEEGLVVEEQKAAYRYLTGFWVDESILRQGVKTIACFNTQKATLFCNYGVNEIEQVMARLHCDDQNYVGIKLSEKSTRVFLCRASQIYRLYSSIRHQVKLKLDSLISELQGS